MDNDIDSYLPPGPADEFRARHPDRVLGRVLAVGERISLTPCGAGVANLRGARRKGTSMYVRDANRRVFRCNCVQWSRTPVWEVAEDVTPA